MAIKNIYFNTIELLWLDWRAKADHVIRLDVNIIEI